MRLRWTTALCALVGPLLSPGSLAAQTAPASVVTAGAPTDLSVTVYRDPSRSGREEMSLDRLGGFALITETRRVRLPRGPAVIRFEGVAGGIMAASAIVTGLPDDTDEVNRDARLLSPASLVDGTLGRQVTLRRTDPATGVVAYEDATVVAGPAPGVVLKTARGVEALRCSGLPETPLYDGVPAGLSATPVLSVATVNRRAATATVTLSYLAQGFDWTASYVGTLADDGESLDLFAWLTLANANDERFANARVQAVAGRLNRQRVEPLARAAAALSLTCYPLGTTTSNLPSFGADVEEIVLTGGRRMLGAMEPMPMVAPAPVMDAAGIVVTGSRVEDVGDLKLYSVPRRVTVAADAQKQVALLARKGVAVRRVYRLAAYPNNDRDAQPADIVLRTRNVEAEGLGLALPAGTTAFYAEQGGSRLLVGRGTLDDTAAGERLRLTLGTSPQVTVAQASAPDPDLPLDGAYQPRRDTVTVTNANLFAVEVEVPIGWAGDPDLRDPSAPLERDMGVQTWFVTVPANDQAVLSYTR